MASEAVAGLATYFGWSFLPGYATGLLQNLYYRLTIRASSPRPQPGQPLYALHHRRIRLAVLCLYLLYILLQALYDIRLAGDFYIDLGVTPSSPDREVKTRFRRLAAKIHPDKLHGDTASSTAGDEAFVHLKLAQDTILDPAKRFAYDRFGPVITHVHHPGLKTIRDYVYAGLKSLVPEYAKGAVVLAIFNYFWLPKWGQYWRYLAILWTVFLELYFLTHEWTPTPLLASIAGTAHRYLPSLLPHHLLPFQILALARRMSISLNIFISQLAPPAAAMDKAEHDRQTQQQLAHLHQVAKRIDEEANNLLQIGTSPFRGDLENVEKLRRGMQEGIVTRTVRTRPEVQEAVQRVLDRRRQNS